MKIENRQKTLAIVAISAVALLAAKNLIFSPLFGVWEKRAGQVAALTKTLNQGTRLLEREKTVKTRWQNMKNNTLPANKSIAEGKVLDAEDRWVQESRIGFGSRKFMWKDTDEYSTLECRAEALGDLQSLMRFLYELEKDPLALKVEDLEISTKDNEGRQLSLVVRFTGLRLAVDQK